MNIFLRHFPAKKTWLNLPVRWKVLVPIFGMGVAIALAALSAFTFSTSRLATESALATAGIVTDRIRADREPFLDGSCDVATTHENLVRGIHGSVFDDRSDGGPTASAARPEDLGYTLQMYGPETSGTPSDPARKDRFPGQAMDAVRSDPSEPYWMVERFRFKPDPS